MSKLIRLAGAVSLAILLGVASAHAAEAPPPVKSLPDAAEQALREGAEKIVKALELLLNAIPQYERPEILPNGDIIIRRKHPESPSKPDAKPAPPRGNDQTKT